MRVYIASLSDYNDGRLEGKWFDLSDYLSASDLMDDIQEMLNDLTKKYKNVDGEVREEWAVHDYEGIPPTLASEYMGEADFEKLLEIRKVAEDRDIPVEVLVERAGDTGSDDYEALADSLVMVVDGSDETDIVYELEDQLGELGNDFWKDYIFIDDVTERVMYGEDVDRFREDILYENPDMDEDEAERQAEEMADEEADRRRDLSTYLEDMGYGDEIPDFVTKDYNDAWKYALSYDYDVIHHDGDMYVFTNNYSVGGTILSGLVGAYIGYKIGRSKPQKKGFETEKKIGRKIKGAFSKKKFSEGGSIKNPLLKNIKVGNILVTNKGTFEITDLQEDTALLGHYDGGYSYFEVKNEDGETKYIRISREKNPKMFLNDGPLYRSSWQNAEQIFAKGGGIGFKGLSAKVAKRYEGKKPEAKYRAEYGKRYSKSEAKEVGDKVAGKVYWQQKGRKMAMGGGLAQYPNDLPKEEAERLFHLAHKNAKVGDRLWNNFKRTPLRLIYANLDERGIKYARGGKLKEGYAIMQKGSLRTDAFKRVEVFPTIEKALFKMSHIPNFKSLSKEEKLKLIVPYSASKMAGGGKAIGLEWMYSDGQYEAHLGELYLIISRATERGLYQVRVTKGYRGETIGESTSEISGLDNAKDLAYDIAGDYYKQYARGGNVNTGRSWHLDRARHNKRESYEKTLANRKRKYEDGGQIGQEIVFDDNGEENTGVIKDITNLGDYVVKADDGRTLLAQRDLDVISLGAMRSASTEAPRKRFGFFEDGGSVSGNQNKRFLDSLDISYKQRILRNIANHYGISIVEAEEEVTDSESENLYEYITDTSLRMKVYNDMKNRRYAQGGGVEKPKYKYYVEWLEDGMLQSEIYNEDEYEQAKELYYQIKYDLFDSQYKRPQIFISDYETGEVVFGDAFEYARGGGVSRFKEGDRVTNKKGKNRGVGFIVKIDSSGMAFVDFEEEGKTEFMSLEDLKKTNQSRYEQGGGVSGIDDLIRG